MGEPIQVLPYIQTYAKASMFGVFIILSVRGLAPVEDVRREGAGQSDLAGHVPRVHLDTECW